MVVDAETRRRVMASIRKRNTIPELRVRRALHQRGLRYRVHVTSLPGTPDIVFPKAKLIIQVHGCFWHQHEACSLARRPKANITYWEPKLARNVARDRAVNERLAEAGWQVVTVWECQTGEAGKLIELADSIALTVGQGTEKPHRPGVLPGTASS